MLGLSVATLASYLAAIVVSWSLPGRTRGSSWPTPPATAQAGAVATLGVTARQAVHVAAGVILSGRRA